MKGGNINVVITFFILALSITAFAQTNADKINHIKQVFKSINTDNTLKRVVIDNEELSKYRTYDETPDGGEELTDYSRNDTLVKIIYVVGLSNRKIAYEYYLENAKPVFVYEKQQYFPYNSKTGEMDFTKLEPGFEGRYYLDGKTVILKLEKGPLRGDKGNPLGLLKTDIPKDSKMLIKSYLMYKVPPGSKL